MNRRKFSIAAISSLALIAGCDSEQKPSPTATLINNSEVQEAMKRLSSAIQELQAQVGDFETQDWKTVVPEVDNAAQEVDSAFFSLKKSLGVQEGK